MNVLKQLRHDFSISALTSAFIVTLVGMTSSAVIVFQAASAFGAGAGEASSWLGSLCVAMGILTVYLSIKYKSPVLIAWSTPGAALLVSGAEGVPLAQAIGAFVVSALLITISGATGIFEKVMTRIPLGLSSALLAGVLLNFALGAFTAFNTHPILIAAMFAAYMLGKKYSSNLTMLYVLLTGVAVAALLRQLHFENVEVMATQFVFVKPEFSVSTILGIGLPLFIVTMASQNVTGFTIMRSYGYLNPISKILTKSGVANLITAFFGGFAINLAAITAAIAMSAESNPNKDKRYVTAVISGVMYIAIGLMAGTVTSLFSAFPKELIVAVAGFALLGTISGSLQKALTNDEDREAAFITFLVAASGFKFLNIGSAFWSLVIGGITLLLMRRKSAA